MPEVRINTSFRHFNPLFKLAKSGLILIISVQLSILFCIDNPYFFHTLFFVSHIFSTNPVPLLYCHYCVQFWWLAGLFTIHRINFCRFASPPMEIIISKRYFCKKKFCGTNRQYHDCFLCTERNQLPLPANPGFIAFCYIIESHSVSNLVRLR